MFPKSSNAIYGKICKQILTLQKARFLAWHRLIIGSLLINAGHYSGQLTQIHPDKQKIFLNLHLSPYISLLAQLTKV